jgi:hypothetical protein
MEMNRVPNDAEVLPEELKTPVGIANDLCDLTNSTYSEASGSSENDGKEEKRGGTEGKGKEDILAGEESPKTVVRVYGCLFKYSTLRNY